MTGLDAEWAEGTATGTVELNGTACTQANTFWFAKRRGFADNTANHIKISTAGTAYVDDYFDGSGTAPAQTAIMVESIYDGTNAPITHVIDTAHPA
jgi:hypothetical protein